MRRSLLISAAMAVLGAVLLRLTVLAPETIPVKAVRVEWGPVESTVTNTKAGTIKPGGGRVFPPRSAAVWWRSQLARETR